jgi:hypothetical protein
VVLLRLAAALGIALDRAGHTARATAATAKFLTGHGDDLDAVLAQHRVGGDVALVAEDDPRGDGQVVVPVVPLLPLGRPDSFSAQLRAALKTFLASNLWVRK